MEIPNSAVYLTIGVYFALFSVSGFLIFYLARQLKIQRLLENNIAKLNQQIKKLKTSLKKPSKVEVPPEDIYKLAVNQQLDHTRKYHESLKSNNDISLDISIKSPKDCQTAAVRNMFLVAERESAATSSDGTPDWNVLEQRIQQLIEFFKHELADLAKENEQESNAKDNEEKGNEEKDIEANDEAANTNEENEKPDTADQDKVIAELKEEINEKTEKIKQLEKLDQLFTEFEERWIDTKREVSQYYNELLNLTRDTPDPAAIELLLDSYNDAYVALETVLVQSGRSKIDSEHLTTSEERENKFVSNLAKSVQEVTQLKEVNQKQQETVAELQARLRKAESIEAKAALVDDLSKELQDMQTASAQSTSCIHMLEEQLASSKQESLNLSNQLEKMKKNIAKIPYLENMVKEFSEESKTMLKEIAALEREGKELQDQIDHPEVSVEDLQELQQKLTELHVQHTELEERYTALKEKSGEN